MSVRALPALYGGLSRPLCLGRLVFLFDVRVHSDVTLSHLFSYETHEHGSGAEESSLDPSWQKKSVTRTWWRFKQAVDNKEILQNSVK